jgi:amino acid transporter
MQKPSPFSALRLFLGRTLGNREQESRKIGTLEGVPAMGLDGLSSAAYGPEAALTILMPLGVMGIAYIGPIMALIVALLLILFASYWQTIRAYPNNGGSYVVSRENLGRNASLLAAAALMVDYVLNVAVGISAGVGALVSAVPSMTAYTLPLCLGVLVLITLVNLRGTQDEGRVFALPTYLFVGSLAAILVIGITKTILAGGHPHAVIAPPPLAGATQAASIWLLLRAFAAGCTAMTGVEAVSNGMTVFREPIVTYGHRTLAVIVVILAVLLLGIAWLAQVYGVHSMDETQAGYQSVLSQLASAVIGNGIFYYISIGTVLVVLALSASTSFVGLPQLCRMVAQDGFLPRPFAIAGRRLVYSVGILYLAVAAGILLIVFGGITDRLIPLFAIGAFLTFTMSQSGMVVHWLKELRQPSSERHRGSTRLHLFTNAVGAFSTGVAFVIIIIAKFTDGAWITVLVIPGVIVLLKSIRAYYDRLDATLRDDGPLDLSNVEAPVVLVVTREWNKPTDRALGFAMRLSRDVTAVHLTSLEGPTQEDEAKLRAEWERDVEAPARAAGLTPPRLLNIGCEYRVLHEPILELVQKLEQDHPDRLIVVLLTELVITRWWQYPLHSRRAHQLRSRLLRYGGSRLMIINVPWYVSEPDIKEGIARATAEHEK